MSLRLSDLWRCFQGVVPSIVATSDSQGIPNVTYVSQVYLVDEQHVALSCQFFNKTRRNLDENASACAQIIDPVTLQAYLLRLRFLRSEKSGPLFDTMAMRIDAIASHTGMTGVFRLIAADVFEVKSVEMVQGFLAMAPADIGAPGASLEGLRTEIRGLQWVSERINRAADLESLLTVVLEALEEYFKFSHTSVLLYDEPGRRLVTLASRGYGRSGIGAEVPLGEGLIGTVALGRRLLRLTSLEADLRYGRAIRREAAGGPRALDAEIPLPGLPDAQSILAIPLAIRDRLVGVLVAEDR
ncbi:MAG: GAF domain-containing protein, partial [Vicinamibacterales bacterium]